MNTMIQKLCIFLSACLIGISLHAQVPTLTGFTPTSGPIGTTVTLTGTNFNTTAANNIVYFGSVKATVSTATSTSLTATVPLGANYQPITVLNTTSGRRAATTRPFKVTFSTGLPINSTSFAAKLDSVTSTRPNGIASGDLNGDGKVDLIISNSISSSVNVYRNTSSGSTISFAKRVDLTTLSGLTGVAVDDLDGDGKLDIAATNLSSNKISIFRNTTSGSELSFAAKVDSSSGSTTQAIAIGDLDGDGKPEIAVVNSSGHTVSVLRNTSSVGTLSFAARVTFPTDLQPYSIAIGDVDGDGKFDLVSCNANGGNISVLRNTNTTIGTLSFAAKVDFAAGGFPFWAKLGDMDGDDKLDVVVVDQGANKVSVLRNTSSSGIPSFATKVDFTAGTTPRRVSLADLDGDGKPEMVVSNLDAYTLSIFKNNSTSGTLSFDNKVDFTTGSGAVNLGPLESNLGDLNGDGKPEIAVVNQGQNSVSFFRNTLVLPSTFTSFSPISGRTGDTILITGTNLSGVTKVAFGDSLASFIRIVSATQVKAVVGKGASGDVDVFVPGDTLSLPNFTFVSCVNPILKISVSPNDTICKGTNVTFMATAMNKGNSVSYQWRRNRKNIGTNSPMFSIDSLSNLDTINCLLIDTCGTIFRVSSDTIVMVVNTPPVLTSTLTPPAACSGTIFTYTPTFSRPATTYRWRRKAVRGISNQLATGTGNISETLTDTTASPVTVTYEFFNLVANGCTKTDTFRVTVVVNPRPIFTSSTLAIMQCSGVAFTYTPTSSVNNTTISWSRALVNGVSNSGNTGIGAISETLNNTNNAPVNVVYVFNLTANGCVNPNPVNLTVTIKPIPALNSTTAPPAICSGNAFNYIPTGTISGTKFSWTRAAVAGISNAAKTDTGRVSETLINTTQNAINVIYQYTALLNGCTSPNPVNVTVSVKPSPVLTSTTNPPAICSGTAFTYTPVSSNVNATFTWTRAAVSGLSNIAGNGSAGINETLTSISSDTVSVVYAYTVTANGCSNSSPTLVTVKVKPRPTLSSSLTPPGICSGNTVNYVPTSLTKGTIFSWTRSAINGISNTAAVGTGNPNEMLTNTASTTINVVYSYSLSANGCSNPSPALVTIPVSLVPTLSSITTPPSICSGTVFSYTPSSAAEGTIFSWKRGRTEGIVNDTAVGNGNPNEILTSNSLSIVNVSYSYKLTLNGCTNPQTYNVTVGVKPAPTLNSSQAPPAICSGTVFSYTPTSAASGASFSWTRSAVNGISNPASSGVGNLNETLVNTTNSSIFVPYFFTISAGGCTNPVPRSVQIEIKPTPRLSNTTVEPICSGTLLSYTPSSTVSGTTLSWTRAAIEGINNAAAVGTNGINEILVNTQPVPLTVNYQYSLTANGCSPSTPITVSIIVNPQPTLSSTLTPPDICTGTTFSYLPKSSTPGTTFTWSRAAVTNISTPAATGTGNPAETLTSTANVPIKVIYAYRLNTTTCSNSDAFNVEVFVNPLPTLNSTTSPSAICSGTVFSYTPTSPVANTRFSWSRATTTGIINSAASGNSNPNETLTNTTAAPITVSYVYTLSLNDCTNPTTYTVRVTVNPQPKLTSTLTPPAICSGTTLAYTPSSNISGTSFTWSRSVVSGINNAGGSGTGNPNETLVNTTASPINVTYAYTLTSSTCTSTNNNVVVVVNPIPTLSSALTLEASCSGSSFSYTPNSATSGTVFTWSRAGVEGISNEAAVGTGSISENLNNTGNTTLTVAYSYTLAANGCSNPASFTVTKAINPLPKLTSSLISTTLCSGTPFTYAPSSTLPNTNFTWTRRAVTGISNPALSGTGNLNETLINTTGSALVVNYIYTLTANTCTNPSTYEIPVTVNAKPQLVITNPTPRCTTLVDLRQSAVTAGSTAGLTLTYWKDAAATQSLATPQSTDAGVYYIKGTNAVTGCFDIKPVTVVVGRIPDAVASDRSICSGISAGITVLNPNAAPGATFNWTATYGNVQKRAGSGKAVKFGANAINEQLINLTRSRTDVVYTITPIGSQLAGCEGTPITVTVKVNQIGQCPEAEPTAFSEIIAHNTAPLTKVNMVKPKNRKKYLVLFVSNPDSVGGVSKAPYTRKRGSTFEENLLQNKRKVSAVVVYTIVPYTNGRNLRDNNGTKDDVLGTSFEVAVTVKPAPGLISGEDKPEIDAFVPGVSKLQYTGKLSKLVPVPQVTESISPVLLDEMLEVTQVQQADRAVLLQNVPNPFEGSTQIGFYLPDAADARLTVRDVKGAVLYQIKGSYAKGWNVLELNSGVLPSSGVLYYSLETAKFVETKRMLLVKR
ncbi:PKD-like domain-containing protein [Haliscomenobacter sp.]|uniref:PKD-like domain-containing protein n=1 Tax=Haliscomenobacter sp. TaxID=2717303 RepID=UPI003364CC78